MGTYRFVDALSGGFALFLPDALHGQSSKLDGFRGAGGGCSDGLFGGGGMPHVSEDGDTYGDESLLVGVDNIAVLGALQRVWRISVCICILVPDRMLLELCRRTSHRVFVLIYQVLGHILLHQFVGW